MKAFMTLGLIVGLLAGCASGSPAAGGQPWLFQTGNTVVITWKLPPGANTLQLDWKKCDADRGYMPRGAGPSAAAGQLKTCMEKMGYVKLDEKWWSDHGLTAFNSYEVPNRATQPDQTQGHFHQ